MFVPLSLATLRSLPPAGRAAGRRRSTTSSARPAAALGIAVLATLLDHRADLHTAHLAESVTALSPATWQRLEVLRSGLEARGLDPGAALTGAYEVLRGVIEREASVLAFRDSYTFVILVIGALLPFVWIFRSRVFDLRNLGGGGAVTPAPK